MLGSPWQSKPMAPVRPIEVTVCKLMAIPQDFDGKLVRFKANFESDGIERSLLLDETCQGGILPYVPSGTPGEGAFNDAIYTGHPGTLDKTITATFTGVFHYVSNPEMCNYMSKEMCRRSITVTRIKDLVLVMKQKR